MTSSFIHKKFQSKILSFTCRSIISLTITENSANFHSTHDTVLPPFNIFHFFSDYAKSGRCTLKNTEILYAHLLKTAILQSNTFVANSLMDWYCKSNSMVQAPRLFDETPPPNVIS